MTFADFVGNTRAVGVLRRMLVTGRIPHALLFAGQKGVGKFTLATLFARAANCATRPGEVCGHCESCRALAALEDLESLRGAALAARGSANAELVPLILRPHPSVCVLVPDGAYIRVAQMRYVVREAYTMPTAARRTFFLIDRAERLRFDLADVLLKVLEEPPEHATLVLVTSAPFELRPTIRSRCIPMMFAPLSHDDIESYLEAHRPELGKAERRLAAAAADGSLGTALSLDLAQFRQVREHALELVRAAVGGSSHPERLFEATAVLAGKGDSNAEESLQGREGFEFSLDVLYSLLIDLLHSKAGRVGQDLRHPDLEREISTLARQASWPWLERAVHTLDQIEGWQRRNVNRQLALDAWALGSPEVG